MGNMLVHLAGEGAHFLSSPEILTVLRWWGWLLISGIALLPLARRVFPFGLDRGYPFAKVLGIVLPCWLLWVASSLNLARFTPLFCLAALGITGLGAWSSLLLPRKAWQKRAIPWKVLALEELAFLLMLLLWAFVRSFQPNIQGLEKFMDFGFVNAALRSTSMPPLDMWLAGESVNYYYFGHVLCAFVTAGSRTLPEYGYNLMLATLFGLTGICSFSLTAGMALKMPLGKVSLSRKRFRAVGAGLAAALLVTLGGNMHAFLFGELFPALGRTTYFESAVKTSYWYPDATRYIGHNPEKQDKTIHEFPLYSFVVADLHGHVSDIPVVLTSVAVTLSAFVGGLTLSRALLACLLLGVAFMTNAWDFPIYLFLWSGALTWYFWKKHKFFGGLLRGIALGGCTALGALAAASPFLYSFQNFSQGILPVMSRSPLWQLFVLWGDKMFFAYCFLLFLLAGLLGHLRKQGPLRGMGGWWRAVPRSDLFALGLFLAGFVLVTAPELVYVKDIYGKDYHRSNTMFKLGYQAFMLFGLASGYTIGRILAAQKPPLRRALFTYLFLAVLWAALCYPLRAIPGYYPLANKSQGLDGLTFLRQSHPGDYEAVLWLRENTTDQAVILEAEGDSYTDYGRISMATGLPTPLGWYVHEWLWHNDSSLPAKRRGEIQTLYQDPLSQKAKDLREKYRPKYMILGAMERKRYSQLKEEELLSLGPLVFESGDTKIIALEYPGGTSPAAKENAQ